MASTPHQTPPQHELGRQAEVDVSDDLDTDLSGLHHCQGVEQKRADDQHGLDAKRHSGSSAAYSAYIKQVQSEIDGFEHNTDSIVEEHRFEPNRSTPQERWEAEPGPFSCHNNTMQHESPESHQDMETSQPRWHDLNQLDYLMTGIGEGTADAGRQAQIERVSEAVVDNSAGVFDGIRRSRDFAPNQVRVQRQIRRRKQALPE